ncbi:MAG TPA: PaeR7I family type II restriction endonuclease, partial [Chthoniobacteraceae bacterium]|nr:PaeR7I family type II restriction endonuclease [Chthoniobacteraceae bacterium]
MAQFESIEEIVDTASNELLLALRQYNATLSSQAARQAEGSRDAGRRAEVTGGKQMDGFVNVIRHAILRLGIPLESVWSEPRGKLHVPGYFRATKMWDLVVVHKGKLLAVLEAKSIASSFGNNMNNRAEEAVGSGADFGVAFREGAFQSPTVPWAGYFFLLPECKQTTSPVSLAEPHFTVLPEFRDASYAKRAEELCVRLV